MDRGTFYRFFRQRAEVKALRLKGRTDEEIFSKINIGPERLELLTKPITGIYKTFAVEFDQEDIIAFFKALPNESNKVQFSWFVKLYTAVVPEFPHIKRFITPPSSSPELDMLIRNCIVAYCNTLENRELWDTGHFIVDHKLSGLVASKWKLKYILEDEGNAESPNEP